MEKEPPSGPYEWYVRVAFRFSLTCTAASGDALASMKDTKEPLNAGGDAALTGLLIPGTRGLASAATTWAQTRTLQSRFTHC